MKKLLVTTITLLSFVVVLYAQIPERPNPPRLVNDFANVLNNNESSKLESALVQFARETSTQIVVVTVAGLDGYDPGDYAPRLAEQWGVGQEGKDNGIVILLKPKTNESKGEIFISTGYGLEGVLPDAVVNSTVIENEMIPYFQQNDYFGGLASGINVIMDITRGEYTAEQYQQNAGGGGGSFIPFVIIMFVLIFGVFGRNRRRRFYSPGRNLPFWLALGMLSGSSHRSSGSFGNFSSGGGSFGGGGFGGFGGGSFGGGGAGGSW